MYQNITYIRRHLDHHRRVVVPKDLRMIWGFKEGMKFKVDVVQYEDEHLAITATPVSSINSGENICELDFLGYLTLPMDIIKKAHLEANDGLQVMVCQNEENKKILVFLPSVER